MVPYFRTPTGNICLINIRTSLYSPTRIEHGKYSEYSRNAVIFRLIGFTPTEFYGLFGVYNPVTPYSFHNLNYIGTTFFGMNLQQHINPSSRTLKDEVNRS